MRSFDRARVSDEAKAAFERGESSEDAVRSMYEPHTPAWRCFQSSYRSHLISSRVAAASARLSCSVPASSSDAVAGETLKSSDPQGGSQ